jgi:hypothetical protein
MTDLGATPGLEYKLLDVQSYMKGINDKYGLIYENAVIPKGAYSLF